MGCGGYTEHPNDPCPDCDHWRTVTARQRCERDATRDVIFLLRWRCTTGPEWYVDSVWLDRDEAETFRTGHHYRWPISEVYGVPANGRLAELLRTDPCLVRAESASTPANAGNDASEAITNDTREACAEISITPTTGNG